MFTRCIYKDEHLLTKPNYWEHLKYTKEGNGKTN